MKKNFIIYIIISLLTTTGLFVSCDDGKIYNEVVQTEREGGSIRLTGDITGNGNWASGYSIVLAGFSDDSEYAKTAKGITTNNAGSMNIVLTGISSEVTTIEICAINRLRKRIVSFYTYDYTEQEDTIRIDVGTVDASMYAAIQTNLFDLNCIACHGGSTSAAAGLYLTSDRSYEALVNVVADKSEDSLMFVNPCNSEESFLHLILNTDVTADWGMDHSDMVTSNDLLQLLDDWIDAGAEVN